MSLVLNASPHTSPKVEVSTSSIGGMQGKVHLAILKQAGPQMCEIGIEDFLCAAAYVLTNTDLVENDARIEFQKWVSRLQSVDGYNKGNQRLDIKTRDAREPHWPWMKLSR